MWLRFQDRLFLKYAVTVFQQHIITNYYVFFLLLIQHGSFPPLCKTYNWNTHQWVNTSRLPAGIQRQTSEIIPEQQFVSPCWKAIRNFIRKYISCWFVTEQQYGCRRCSQSVDYQVPKKTFFTEFFRRNFPSFSNSLIV